MATANCYDSSNKKDIIFRPRPIVDESGIGITIPAGGKRQIGSYEVNKDCEYFKIVCGLSCDDTTISSQDHASVGIEFTILYKDNDTNNYKNLVDSYFPKYFHETNDEYDSAIIGAPGKVKMLVISAFNNEDEPVDIDLLQVYVALKADVTPESVGENLSEYYNNGGQTTLVIPLVQELPDINSVPDGYICRLATID